MFLQMTHNPISIYRILYESSPAVQASTSSAAKQAAPKDPVLVMFEKYREQDEDKIGPEGIMLLCQDLQIEPTDVMCGYHFLC
jgi:hypothetical protein